MKLISSILFLGIAFASCSPQNDKTKNETAIPANDTAGNEDKEDNDRPSSEFIRLISTIDSSGYHGDSSLSYLKKQAGKFTFYKMNFKETPLFLHKDPSAYVNGADYCALNIDAFKNCGKIWELSPSLTQQIKYKKIILCPKLICFS